MWALFVRPDSCAERPPYQSGALPQLGVAAVHAELEMRPRRSRRTWDSVG